MSLISLKDGITNVNLNYNTSNQFVHNGTIEFTNATSGYYVSYNLPIYLRDIHRLSTIVTEGGSIPGSDPNRSILVGRFTFNPVPPVNSTCAIDVDIITNALANAWNCQVYITNLSFDGSRYTTLTNGTTTLGNVTFPASSQPDNVYLLGPYTWTQTTVHGTYHVYIKGNYTAGTTVATNLSVKAGNYRAYYCT